MMENLMRKGEEIALASQRRKAGRIAARVSELLGEAAVEVREARVIVSGRGLLKRWLIDPALRFLASDLK